MRPKQRHGLEADQRTSQSSPAGAGTILRVDEWLEMFAGAGALFEVLRKTHHGRAEDVFARGI